MELGDKRKVVDALKRQLLKAHQSKEEWYQKKEALKLKIVKTIGELKLYRSERDRLNKSIKDAKIKRHAAHQGAQLDREGTATLESEQQSLSAKSTKLSPSALQAKIAQTELSIETEVMSFPKETALMKNIKGWKREYYRAESLQSLRSLIRQGKRGAASKQKEAHKIHSRIQKSASESQKRHEALLAKAKELRIFEKEEEQAFENFISKKREAQELHKKMRAALKDLEKMASRDRTARARHVTQQKQKHDAVVKDQENKTAEKFLQKKKLTMDDLLALQEIRKKR